MDDAPAEDAEVRAWLLVRGRAVPKRWRRRAETVHLLPLLPREVDGFLGGESRRDLDQQEEALLSLLAQGLKVDAIAERFAISQRSVDRRLSRLRARLNADSKADLARLAARWGFGP